MRRTMVVVMLRGGQNVGLIYETRATALDVMAACQSAIDTGRGPDGGCSINPPTDADDAAVLLDAAAIDSVMVAPEPSRSIHSAVPARAIGKG